MNRQKFHFCASKTDNKHSVFMYGSSLAYFAPHPREFHVPPRKITVFRFTRLILLKAAKRAIWIDLVCFRFFRFLLSLIIFRVAARTSVRNAPDPAISCAFFPTLGCYLKPLCLPPVSFYWCYYSPVVSASFPPIWARRASLPRNSNYVSTFA